MGAAFIFCSGLLGGCDCGDDDDDDDDELGRCQGIDYIHDSAICHRLHPCSHYKSLANCG